MPAFTSTCANSLSTCFGDYGTNASIPTIGKNLVKSCIGGFELPSTPKNSRLIQALFWCTVGIRIARAEVVGRLPLIVPTNPYTRSNVVGVGSNSSQKRQASQKPA
jgi:hypothetical protein